MSSKQIFVSHAVNDKALADAFVDLLQTGANVTYSEIFCSSLEGLGIPVGVDFIDHIKDQIQSPKVVVAIISRNYLASQFCMCELGAGWAMSHKLLPILVPPLKYSDVQGVLKASQLVRIDDESALSQFASELSELFPSAKVNIPRWNVKSRKFLQHLPERLSECGAPNIIPIAEHESVKKELAQTKAALTELDDENESLKDLVKDLEGCKDKRQVSKVKRSHSSEEKQFDMLVDAAERQLKELPRSVALVACKAYGPGEPVHIDPFKDKDVRDEADDAVGKQYLIGEDNVYSLNRQHPKIKQMLKALESLSEFLSEATPEFYERFVEENDFPLSLENRDFWEWGLYSKLARVYV